MPNIAPLPPQSAPENVQKVYEEFYRRMSFPGPPNFIMTQGHSHAAVRGTTHAVCDILVEGEIPRWQKELIFVAISKDRNCKYCFAAHVACCRMLGVESGVLDKMLVDVSLLQDPVLRAMLSFCRKCARDPQSLSRGDFDELRRHRLKELQLVELVAMSAFAVYANIIADATGMEPDEMFGQLAATG